MAFLKSMLRPNRWPLWIGGLVGILILVWLLRDLDLSRFVAVVRDADLRPLALLPLAVVVEQVFRAVKWWRLLTPLRSVGLARLFGAIMAGYLVNTLAPVRVSPLVRAWLIARLEGLSVGAVLATVATDRLVDGWIFLGLAAVVVSATSFPAVGGALAGGLWQGLAGGLIALLAAVAGLWELKRLVDRPPRMVQRLARRLPARPARVLGDFVRRFAEGLVLPRGLGALAVILGASVAMKALAATHFVWAGYAFGIVLSPPQYLFLMVFLGFLVTLAGTLRIVGGFTAGAVYGLGLFGVEVEKALAMAVVVETASHLTVLAVGAASLWLEGLSLSALRLWRTPAEDGDRGEAQDDLGRS
ncbi:MAG: lysylphosphatidylglycerol synthase transmembrane domain-containing protein [Kiloniellaceae bacterium]